MGRAKRRNKAIAPYGSWNISPFVVSLPQDAGDFEPMPTEVTREELTTLEREVEGEKIVTRHILEQTRRNGDDLAAVKSRLDRVEQKLDGLERKFDGLNKNLPKIVGEVMRDVLDERDRQR
jgi:hypothetical protein